MLPYTFFFHNCFTIYLYILQIYIEPLPWKALAPDLDTRDTAKAHLYGTHILEQYWTHSRFKNKQKAKGSKELQYRTKSMSGVWGAGRAQAQRQESEQDYSMLETWPIPMVQIKSPVTDFPRGPAVKNPPTKGRTCGFDPWSRKIPRAERQLSLWATTMEPMHSRAHTLQQEKPPQWEAHTPKLERACAQQQRLSTAWVKNLFKKSYHMVEWVSWTYVKGLSQLNSIWENIISNSRHVIGTS